MEESTAFTRNTRILIIGEIVTFVFAFGCNYFLIRFLSIVDFSVYNLVLVVPTILLYIGDFGINYGSSYYIARLDKLKRKEESRNVIKITLITKSILGIGLTITIFIFAENVSSLLLGIKSPSLIPLIQLTAFLVFTKILLEAVQTILIGSAKMNYFTIVSVVYHITRFVATILLVLLSWILLGPIIGLVLSTGIAGLLGLLYIWKRILKNDKNKQKINWKCLPQLIKRGFSFSLISAIHNVRHEVFILILALFSFYNEVSYLKVGVAITSIFYVILRPVMISLFPIFSKYSWNNISERTTLTQVFQYSIKFCNLIISPVIIFCIVFASELVPLIFGLNYTIGSQFISFFLVFYLTLTIGMIAIPTLFFGQGYSNLAFLIEFISFIASIICGICLSLYMGTLGFTIGISLGAFFGLFVGIITTNRIFGKELFSKYKESIFIIIIGLVLCGFFLIIFNFLTFVFVLNNIILKLIVIGGTFVFFYILFLIVLIRVNLIKYEEMSFFIREFQKFPFINRFIPFFFKIGKKIWKNENNK